MDKSSRHDLTADHLRLSKWKLRVGIGAYRWEQRIQQTLVIDVRLFGDFRLAAASDNLEDALDYSELKKKFEAYAAGRRWRLLESFTEDAASFFLKESLVHSVEVTVEKPRALAPASVRYTILRSK